MLTGVLLLYICSRLALPTWCWIIGGLHIVVGFGQFCATIYNFGKKNN